MSHKAMKIMSRKAIKKQQFFRECCTIEDLTKEDLILRGLTQKEILEITQCIKFWIWFYKWAKFENPDDKDYICVMVPTKYLWHSMCEDDRRLYIAGHPIVGPRQEYNIYLSLLNNEAKRKKFESLLAYVRFLKLTFLEDDGTYGEYPYHLVSKAEQSHAKCWVHMKPNFMRKWDICIELATPESKHVWVVPEREHINIDYYHSNL
ncbi:unnamed protein product [Meganyctiphanes norvegica]|uniref:Uncharacterized protein n=1 Tax=Meganyctiphanes norvegica TaxID=48144 RepID=A0AAV2R6P5_MEGNR